MNFIKVILLSGFFIPLFVNAETALTEKDILGNWTVNFEANDAKGASGSVGSSAVSRTWTFKSDGVLTSTIKDNHPNARNQSKIAASLKYRIEDGKLIMQVAPGRSKEDVCSALEMEGADLLLKCRFLYYSLTKK